MIRAVRCDQESFRQVLFEEGFNVVLAQRTEESTEKDSRNKLGKTSLIEIIHFCLGSTIKSTDTLSAEELQDWTFILDLTLKGKEYSVHRNTFNRSNIIIEGDFSDWPIKPEYSSEEDSYIMGVRNWTSLLGYLMFDLPIQTSMKYNPTFRSLVSYFIRRGKGAFLSPFTTHEKQKEWDSQVNNTYLLGLNWGYAAEFQIIKDKGKTLKDLKKAADQELLTGFFGTLGELDAERIRLEEEVKKSEEQLRSFKVHPQYYDIEKEANRLTEEIHEVTNNYTLNQHILLKYEESITEERDVSVDKVKQMYDEVGLVFSSNITKRLDEIMSFHKKVVENRKNYLQSEIDRISREIEEQKSQIKLLSDKRSELLNILRTHGALEEHSKLQERITDLKQQLEEIKNRIDNLRKFEEGKSILKIAKEELLQRARRDFEERKTQRERAIRFFNSNSERLYAEPGILSIDIAEKGYRFNVDIKGKKSEGIDYMKIFCSMNL
ncbi:MAG: hypothetical protein AYK19_20075 [Theionarchaea archaeon DG-70-1]|nr:MAG: hypothetical protein AYK19_20075 [Theionarchaea archaeon DG-70-1]